jgi:hypothetical protein
VLPEAILNNPAYLDLSAKGLDRCGLTMLANRSVGASFVGAFTSSLVIAELLRMTMGAHNYEVMDGTLRSLENRDVFSAQKPLPIFNVGFTTAKLKAEAI